MDIFDKELLNFWSQLNGQVVRYIMVGGIATNLHGYRRTTNDVDVWIEDTRKQEATSNCIPGIWNGGL
jgi:hypothetical protein